MARGVLGLLTLVSVPLVADSLFRALYLLLQLAHKLNPFSPSASPSPISSSSLIAHRSLLLPRLAVVIAAHDEAGVIGATVAQIRRSHYPPTHLAVFVIADNCQDATAHVARAAGARVWQRQVPAPRGKGAALAWFLQTAATDLAAYDALVVLDADTQLDPDALTHLASALDRAPVAQGFIQPLHANGATVASLAAYSEILSQAVDDVARARLGWPVPLRGTGMALSPRLLAELTPRLRTRIEDTELSLLLAQVGIPIAFAADALIGDPKPADAALASRQRARWLQGRLELMRHYWPLMLRLLAGGRLGDAALTLTLTLRPKTLALAAKAVLAFTVWLYSRWQQETLSHAPVGFALAARRRRRLDCKSSRSKDDSTHRIASILATSLLAATAIDLAYYPVGLALVKQPRLYARVLLRAPTYGLMWVRGLWTALTNHDAWLSVRRRPPSADD